MPDLLLDQPLAPLPRRLAPVHGETAGSYLHRLARANHQDYREFTAYLSGNHNGGSASLVTVERLAAAAGLPPALIDERVHGLRFQHAYPNRSVRRARSRCTARRGIQGQVLITVALDQPLCRRHRRWLASRAAPGEEYELTPVPEILRAHRHYTRLVHQHEQRHHVAEAYGHARHILQRWTACGDWSSHRERRLASFLETSRYRATEFHPLIPMVNYPETVALARILANPRWVVQATARGRAGLARFHREVRNRLQIDYEPYHGRDPLDRWRELAHFARPE